MPGRSMPRASVALALSALVLAACATAAGDNPSPSTVASPPSVSPTVSPSVSPAPPSPSPGDPSAEPSASPTVGVVRFETPVLGRITGDGVAVRVRPGLDEPIVEGFEMGPGTEVPEVRLASGDMVGLIWGPMLHDGHTWYAVRHHDARNITWAEGWIAADFVEPTEPIQNLPPVAVADGQGSGGTATVTMPQGAQLYVDVMAAPMPGEDRCEATVAVLDPEGRRIEIGSGEVSELTIFFASPLEQRALSMPAGGDVTLEVETDCSWAGLVENPQG